MAQQTLSTLTIKRLAGDAKLMKKDPILQIDVYPDETNQLIWYFCIAGEPNSKYEGGYFIGRIRHNPEYPLKAPEVQMLTPSGKFHINNPICLTNTAYHPEAWSSSWTIHAFLLGFISFWDDDKSTGIGHLNENASSCKRYAADSIAYNLKHHKDVYSKFQRFVETDDDGQYLTTKPYHIIEAELNSENERKAKKKADKAASKANADD